MKTLIAIVLAMVSMSAMASGHDYKPNPRYDNAMTLNMGGVQWQTWSGNTGLNHPNSGVPAEFPELIYMTLGGWGGNSGALRCEYKFAAKVDPIASAKNRAVNPNDFVYDLFIGVNCPHEMYNELQQMSVGTSASRKFIITNTINRNVRAIHVQAAWEGLKSRIFSDFSGSNCTRIHSTIDNWRSNNEVYEEWCY